MKDLSSRQREVLDFISEFLEENGYPPTVRDIQAGCGISSTSVVDYNLNALREKGFLRRRADVSRGIELIGGGARRSPGDVVSIPVLGTIAAGAPITLPSAEDAVALDAEDSVELPQAAVGDPSDLYALHVRGQSMIDALIDDGDLVIMKRTNRVENGAMAAVRLRLDNETTLKRFHPEGATVRLQPANSQMEPIRVSADDVEVLGRVLAVWRYLG